MIKRDYYEVLEIERTADAVEIKRVYRKIALECHPDRCDGDKEKEKHLKRLPRLTKSFLILKKDKL